MSEKLLELSSRAALFDSIAGLCFFLWILCIALFFVTIYLTEGKVEEYKNLKYGADTKEEKEDYKTKAYLWEKRQDRFLTIIFLTGVVMFIGFVGFLIASPGKYSGNVSQIHPVEEKAELDGISLEAYYVVSYDRVDNMTTISVFVKNNTDKWLDNAKVCEGITNKCTIVENLEPGSERIVSIDTPKTSNYYFEVKDVQFSD